MSKFFSREPVEVDYIETKYRKISTPIPCKGSVKILDSLDLYESRSMHGQIPLVWEKAKNFNLLSNSLEKWCFVIIKKLFELVKKFCIGTVIYAIGLLKTKGIASKPQEVDIQKSHFAPRYISKKSDLSGKLA